MNSYYVYRHIRKDTNTPFYIGKGKGKRAFQTGAYRNDYWNRIAAKHDYEVEIIMEGLSEEQAFDKEIEFIKMYKSLGYCEANMTDGGEGTSGLAPWNKGKTGVYSEETRKKCGSGDYKKILKNAWITKRKNGTDKPWNLGIPMSKKSKIKRAKNQGLRKFNAIDTKTDKIIWTGLLQTDCIKALNLTKSSKGNINMCLKGTRKTHKGYRFEYVN